MHFKNFGIFLLDLVMNVYPCLARERIPTEIRYVRMTGVTGKQDTDMVT